MNSAEYVDSLITDLKNKGIPLSDVAWQIALACVGWPYVFGGRGEYCTPANRRARDWEGHPTIKSKCKNFDGSGSCSGCKWYPSNKRVRFYDCRGFTYWVLLQVYGWKLMGAGATSQWNTETNWKAKGTIDTMPNDTLVCLFVQKGKTMEHTGFGLNNETIECSNGVQHFTTRNKKWTHWGLPVCVAEGEIPVPTPTPTPAPATRPTLRRGDKGEWVTVLQTKLSALGYNLGPCGIDGDYGRATQAAVRQFQMDKGLTQDGICGPKTWDALESVPVEGLYVVHIPRLTLAKATELEKQYAGAWVTEDSTDA